MPLVKTVNPFLTEPFRKESISEPEPTGPSQMEIAGSAFRQENDLVNLNEWLGRDNFQPEFGFRPREYAEERYKEELEAGMLQPTARARSRKEFEFIRDKMKKEEKDREILMKGGLSGFAWTMAAGVASPLSFLPFVGQARGAKAAAQGLAYVGAAAALEEGALQYLQETRTAEESAIAIGAGMALGGILGGAVGFTRNLKAPKTLDELAAELEGNQSGLADDGVDISMPAPGMGSSVGAARSFDVTSGTQGFRGAQDGWFGKFGVGKWSLETLSPVTRALNSSFATARFGMTQFSDAGLKLAGMGEGKVGAQGGNIVSRRAGWNAHLAKSLTGMDEIFAEYVFGAEKMPAILRGPRAFMRAQRDPHLLSQNEFNLQVSRYMRSGEKWAGVAGDPKATEAVKKAGDLVRKELYEPMFKEMKALGMLPEDIKTVGDAEYLNRIYDIEYIKAHQNDFIDILAKHFEKKRKAQFIADAGSQNKKAALSAQEIEDLSTDEVFAAKVKEALNHQLADMQKSEIQELIDEIKWLEDEAADVESMGDHALAKELREEAAKKQSENGAKIKAFEDTEKSVRKRLRTLEKAVGSVTAKRDAKLRKIEAIERQQLNALDRVGRAWAKMLKQLDSPKLSFERQLELYNKAEKRAINLVKRIEANEKKLAEIADADDGDLTKFLGQEAVKKQQEKLDILKAYLTDKGNLIGNIDDLRATIKENYADTRGLVNDINNRRALRMAKLREEIKKLNPDAVKQRIAEIQERIKNGREKFVDKWRERGFDEIDLGDVAQSPRDLITNKRIRDLYNEVAGEELDRAVFNDFHVVNFDDEAVKRQYKERGVKLDEVYLEASKKFKDSNDALKWIMENSQNPSYQLIARRLIGNLQGADGKGAVEIFTVKNGDIIPFDFYSNRSGFNAFHTAVGDRSGKGKDWASAVFFPEIHDEQVMLHELIHSTAQKRLYGKDADAIGFRTELTELQRDIYQSLGIPFNKDNASRLKLWDKIEKWAATAYPNENYKEIAHRVEYALGGQSTDTLGSVGSLTEFMTVVLTESKVQEFFKTIKVGPKADKTVWQAIVDRFAKAFGIVVDDGEEYNALQRILEITDDYYPKELEPKRIEALDYFNPKLASAVDNGARGLAADVVDKIKGNPAGRLIHYDMLSQGERGPELARHLDIPSEEIEPFLENNVEKLMRAYTRTTAPDLEIMRTFGSVNAQTLFDNLKAEYDVMLEASKSVTKKRELIEEYSQKLKSEKDPEKIAQLRSALGILRSNMDTRDLNKAYEAAVRDLGAVIGRLRHTWGVPKDPGGWAARGVRIAQNINTLRLMGMVAVSSVPDIARGVMKYGPVRYYQSGLKPLFTAFKELKMSAKEAKLAGTALDLILHTRMYEMMDMADEFTPKTRIEKGLEFATSKMGIVSGFDYWNFWMKSFAGALANAEILDDIAVVMDKTHKGLRTPAKAIRALADMNIDGPAAHDIWRLVSETKGGGKVNGVWLPQTEEWMDAGASLGMGTPRVEELLRIYRAAIVREVDSTIVTPGVERPLWMDASLTGKLIGQFRSFSMSSTQMTLMAGLQERDARFALGSAMSLAMGLLSYQLWAAATGHDSSADEWDKVADEMIDRSGLLGVFGEVRNIGSTIPWMNDYVMLSGGQTTRRGGTGAVASTLGPSFDLATTMSSVLSGLDDPTMGTVRSARKMMPFQNVWWARQMWDQALENIDLPADRR
jgi:hypothetical protein